MAPRPLNLQNYHDLALVHDPLTDAGVSYRDFEGMVDGSIALEACRIKGTELYVWDAVCAPGDSIELKDKVRDITLNLVHESLDNGVHAEHQSEAIAYTVHAMLTCRYWMKVSDEDLAEL